ncbi:hypothetical protein C8J55DRAFT_498181 [Lentinula edodes]|uniref:DUF6534 domain-containing protein n=1 Tax=Lentinula lateritia TaxID=40482 RepID=A0A9W9B0F6_9AGAR|nr:hypothetical protein C8J55DRAFT_498181 [Lentinula edodes]
MAASPNATVSETFGAMYIGAMISMALYGITTLQTYFFFLNYVQDHISIKALVAVVWVLDTVHSELMCHAMYQYLIMGYIYPEIFDSGTWSLFASVALNVIGAFISQCFFTKRIHDLSQHHWFKSSLSISTACIVLGHFIFGIYTVIQFSIRKSFSRLEEVTYNCVIPFGVFAILSDIVIASALILLLRRSRTEFGDTNSLIKKLIVYAINRCVLTSVVAILEVILFLSFPNSMYSFAFDFVIGKLYANSLLASLNSRRSLQRHNYEDRRTSTQFSTVLHVMSSAMETDHRVAQEESLRSMGSKDFAPPSSFDKDMGIAVSSSSGNGYKSLHERRRSMPMMSV